MLYEQNILYTYQYGFRPNYSTSTAHTYVRELITIIDNKQSVIVLFVYISKAFDNLDHNILLNILEHYGV